MKIKKFENNRKDRMKYLKLFEIIVDRSEYKKICTTYYIIDLDQFEDSINKLSEIIGHKIKPLFNYKKVKQKVKQKYLCVSINYQHIGKRTYNLVYVPLIMSNLNFGEDFLDNYDFGGYINCTKEEVEKYKYLYLNIKKYNL